MLQIEKANLCFHVNLEGNTTNVEPANRDQQTNDATLIIARSLQFLANTTLRRTAVINKLFVLKKYFQQKGWNVEIRSETY